MRKPSSPADALEAVSFLSLFLVPLIPHVLIPNAIDCEDALELPQGCGNVALVDGNTATWESLVMHRTIDDLSEPLTGIRIVRRREMTDIRLLLEFPKFFRRLMILHFGLGSESRQHAIPLAGTRTTGRLQPAVVVDPGGSVGRAV